MMGKESVEKTINKKIVFEKTFKAGEDFAAHSEAIEFLKRFGYSVGSMQRTEPIGVALGDCDISKWRNLGPDVTELDGVMVSESFRNGDVTVYLSKQVEE